jgi:hypothetical protein
MKLELPPPAVSDWHLVVHLGLYPEWSRLSASTYGLSKRHPSPSCALFTPRILGRPENEWDAIQSLSYGIDLLCARLYS